MSKRATIRRAKNGTLDRASGAVLLFSLLVMASVMIGSVGLGSLILESLRQTKLIDQSTIAFYAAESGVEEGLFNARRTGLLPPSSTEPVYALPFGESYAVDIEDGAPVVYTSIPQDTMIELDLYDVANHTLGIGLDRIRIEWDCDDGCGGCSQATVTLVSWPAGGPIFWEPRTSTFSYPCPSIDVTLGEPADLHKLRIRAKNATLQNVRVRGLADIGGGVFEERSIPGRVEIVSVGEYADVRRTMRASMPRSVPAAGLYDFVMFSECSIVKGGRPISCP